MMNSVNRRTWLKSSALLLGGITLMPKGISALAANSAPSFQNMVTDESVILDGPPILKARLSANENPFGPSAKAKKAMEESLPDSYQYPFLYTRELRQKIADYEKVSPEQVLLSAGSSPLLLASAMYFSRNGGNIITGDPSYADLTGKAEAFNATVIRVPLTSDHSLDLDAMEKKVNSSTSLVYICNPNNPTGTVLDAEKLKSFCSRVSKKTTVFIDEAYIDYLEDPQKASMMEGVRKNENLIIARTFSKLYGFAGLRVGYVVAQPDIVEKLSIYTTGAFSISAPAIKAALVSYQDQEFLKDALQKTMNSKNFLYQVLKDEGYEYIPSGTNFVMFPLKMDGKRFSEEMMKRSVGIRTWQFSNRQWCRVSIGRMDEMQAFATAFKQLS